MGIELSKAFGGFVGVFSDVRIFTKHKTKCYSIDINIYIKYNACNKQA